MPRGLPDYYNPDTLVSQRLANVEEVVTALRGIASLDNRGRTLFFEDFHSNMSGWVLTNGNDGVDPAIDTGLSLVPPSSCKLNAGTSGNNGFSTLTKRFHLGASAKLGFETAIWYHEDAPSYKMEMRYNLAGVEYFSLLRLLPTTGALDIWSAGGYNNIGNVGYAATANGAWLSLKLVADYANGLYTRILAGQLQIDVSDYILRQSVQAAAGHSYFYLLAEAINAVTNDGYFGFVAGTVDEP